MIKWLEQLQHLFRDFEAARGLVVKSFHHWPVIPFADGLFGRGFLVEHARVGRRTGRLRLFATATGEGGEDDEQ